MIYQTNNPITLWENDGKTTIKGLAIAYYDGSPGTEALRGGVYHRITPLTEIETKGMRAFWSHNHAQPIGSVKLKREVDGFHYTIRVNKTSWAQDAIEAIRQAQDDGEPLGTSFGATDMRFRFRKDGSKDIAEVTSMRVFEVSPVAIPAFSATSAMVASADQDDREWEDIYQRWIVTQDILERHGLYKAV